MSSDGEILARSVGQPDAFAALFDRHARVVAVFVARRIGTDAAQDVLNETFLTAFRRRGDFDAQRGSVRSWLLGIAATLVRRHRSDEAAHWQSVVAAERGAVSADDDGGVSRAEERVDAHRALRPLAERIAGLPDYDRDVLLLYAWGELSYDEIAVALDIPVGTVRSRLNRVRRRLSSGAAVLAATAKNGGETDGRVG